MGGVKGYMPKLSCESFGGTKKYAYYNYISY